MFTNAYNYKKENNVEDVLKNVHVDDIVMIVKNWPRGFMGVDKIG